MKAGRKSQPKVRRAASGGPFEGVRLLAVALLALPFVALTPNFFVVPDLQYQGNATQEVAIVWAAGILVGVSLIVLARAKSRYSLDRDQVFMLASLGLFLLWATISLAWTPELAEGFRLIAIWLCFAIYFTVALFQLDLRSSWWLSHVLSLLILILAISQFIEYRIYKGEMFGVFFSHGITSELLALTLPLQAAIYLTTRKMWLAVTSLLIACAGAGALLLTLRRGPLLGVAVGAVFIVVASLRGWLRPVDRWRLITALVAVTFLAGGVLTYKREELMIRLRGAFQIQTARAERNIELGLTSRLAKWLTGWEMAKRNPIVGIGNGGFPAEYGKYRRYFVENPAYATVAAASESEDYDEIRSPNVHNEFLQIVDELGLIGLILWGFFWVMVIRLLWRARSSLDGALPIGALSGLIAFGISSAISGFSLRFSPSTIIAACVAGLGCAAARYARAADDSTKEAPAAFWTLPKVPALIAGGLLLVLLVGIGLRNLDVMHSQAAQSQIDFRFSLDAPALNEGLLRRYEQTLSLDEANSGAHLGMGFLLYQVKRPEAAIPHLEFAYRHAYNRPYTPVLLAFALEQTGDLDRAIAILSETLVSYPKSFIAHLVRAELYEKQGKQLEAAQDRAAVERQDPSLARAWQIALRLKSAPASAEARRQKVKEPTSLEPVLVRAIVQARAYHYLK
ncbi:MAG: O-antigen ligase family protein [Acidobacteriota bacterium]